MLSLALVLIVGLGSVGLYLTAYVYPEIHRKTDVWWSGTGLFYALILLIYRRPVGLLLGHTASVVLLVWLSYQALQRRWAMVEANPPQPEAGSWGAETRKMSDQVIAKIASVDWQGLWEKMGARADDGTADKSILPPAIKQRLDLSGLGDKLKGMISGKPAAEPDASPDVGKTMQSTEVAAPEVESAAEPLTEPIAEATVQPAPVVESPSVVESPPVVEEPSVQAPPEQEVAVEPPTAVEPPKTVESPPPSANAPVDSPVQVQTEPVKDEPPTVEPNADKAELAAELDQVISDLSPEQKDATPNLPQPPDPLE